MNNSLIISDGLKKNMITEYQNKMFKTYERILKEKEKLFRDKDFELVMFKQKFDTKSNEWVIDTSDKFDKVEYDNGYKCIVTFALYKNGENFIVNNKKVMKNYYITDITKRTEVDNKWIVKYFVLNKDLFKDLEYFYVLTSTM